MGVEAYEAEVQVLNDHELSQTSEKSTSYYDNQFSKLGLTRYGLIRDADLQSIASSDDTSSVVDSVFSDNQDILSVVSSQSSDASSGSDSSEEGSDGESAPATRARLSSNKSSSKDFSNHREEILSGLSSEALPFRTLPPINKKNEVIGSRDQPNNDSTTRQQDHAQQVQCPRRRSGAEYSVVPPPRLKRDTETSDCFVMLLICKFGDHVCDQPSCLTLLSAFATRLITAIWPLSACPPLMSSSFNGAGVLPLEVFIHETLRRSKTSYSTLQVALWYLVLLKSQLPSERSTGGSDCRAIQCGRRMFLAALMLASKYLQDRNYSTRAWSKISGLRMCEINENEMNYLKAINYDLHMKKDVFDNWSRLVINLSKLSKTKPGCFSGVMQSGDLASDGHQKMLAAMAGDASQPRLDLFTCQWWNDVLKQLNPQLCQESKRTDAFLHKIIPQNLLSDHRVDLSSAVGSPTYASDASFSDNGSNKGTQSGTSTPTYSQSPVSAPPMQPLRPQPRNLPTPMSTPRQSEPCPTWLARSTDSSNPTLRCSASVDAFRNVRKQCLANANLERCPPPRPQSYHTTSAVRPAVSSQLNPFSLPSPATSVSSCARSRSSSISSNSSWSGCNTSNTLPGVDQLLQYRSQEPSPLTRVVSMPESRYPVNQAPAEHTLRRKPQMSDISAARSHAAAAKSALATHSVPRSCDSSTPRSSQSNVDAEIADALLQMARMKESSASIDVRGHKRNISSTSERTNENLRPNTQRQPGEEVMSDTAMKTQLSFTDLNKGWQAPNKSWACAKKPMPRLFDHKRMALYCAPQDVIDESAASKQAALYLRDQFVSA